MTNLVPYKNEHFDALNAYQLDEAQAKFTASIDFCINERKDLNDPLKMVVVILENEQPVGFFVLDRGTDKATLTDNRHAVLVRSLSINPAYQGKGIGKRAMQCLPEFVGVQFADVEEIVLSVNVKNTSAYHVYIKAGYTDTGKIITGPVGPQHVLAQQVNA